MNTTFISRFAGCVKVCSDNVITVSGVKRSIRTNLFDVDDIIVDVYQWWFIPGMQFKRCVGLGCIDKYVVVA